MKTPANPWPYAIILTFVLFISGTIGLVVMASSQRVDLVSNNYYEQELKYQGQIDDTARARALSAPVHVVYDRVHRRIGITLPPEQRHRPVTGRIQLYRPSEAALDRQLKLQTDAQGCQTIDTADLRPGLWKVHLNWTVGNEEFASDQQIIITGPQ